MSYPRHILVNSGPKFGALWAKIWADDEKRWAGDDAVHGRRYNLPHKLPCESSWGSVSVFRVQWTMEVGSRLASLM